MPDIRQIKSLRAPKNSVDPFVPYHFLHENEVDKNGEIQQVNTVFLTNKECPFQCLMCDLWKNTLDEPTPKGANVQQIAYALSRLPEAPIIKLYNSGNFFDQKAVPPEDYPEIVKLLENYERVIVENHPNLCNDACLTFRDMLNGSLEVALGLETIHPKAMEMLNKQITPDDYKRATNFLTSNGIDVRTFILLNPPYITDEKENIEWTMRSVEFAFDHGSDCCSIIPTRSGNGIMERLEEEGHFFSPKLNALEEVFDLALFLNKGRVLVDLWDLEKFSDCTKCFEARRERLEAMNFKQKVYPRVKCHCSHA